MHTNKLVSCSTSVDAAPPVVLGLVGDPCALPRWAPRFADRVLSAEGTRWALASGGDEFEIRVLASREAGTIDFLAPEEERGLFARVVPSGEGSAVTFTLVMPATTPAAVMAEQRDVLEQELAALRALCER
jgi:hypothetical protein